MIKKYKTIIEFYYDAVDENEAVKISDSIANYVEETDSQGWSANTIQAKVNEPYEV